MMRPALLAAVLSALVAAPGALAQGGAAAPGKAAKPAPAPAGKPDGAKKERQPVTVDADRMERYGKESLVVFIGNVVARHDGSVQYADRMEVYLDEAGDRIVRTVSTGNVRIVTADCKTGTARRSEWYELEQRMVLIGDARVWQDDNVVTGETITIYTSQDRSLVEGGEKERVKAVFHRREREQQPGAARATAGRTGCAN